MNFFKTILLVIALIMSTRSLLADCLFCNVVSGKEQATVIAQNNDVIVFESIRPRYTSHWLIIPKQHMTNLKEGANHQQVLGKLLEAAGNLGKQLDGQQAFNIQINEGAAAGQTVFHLHVHFYSNNALTTTTPKI